MAPKRKSLPAPAAAAAHSSSSDDDSSSDAEQYVAQRNPPSAETPKPTEHDESDSDSGSESDIKPKPPTKTLKTPQKLSESEDSSEEDEEEEQKEKEEVEKIKSPVKTLQTPHKPSESEDSSEEEEEEEEQEQVDKPKSLVKVPESEPDQKKQKLSTPDQSLTKKLSVAQRIWSLEDEMTLLNALCEYQVRNNKLPPIKDYASFLSGISGSISFPVVEKQLFNKIRQLRFNYNQKKKKGSNFTFSDPHEKAVFELCTKLFEDGSSASKNGSLHEMDCDVGKKSDGKRKKKITKLGSQTEANGVANGGDVERFHFYLEGLIKDLISTGRCPRGFSSVDDVLARIGESRTRDLEAKTKMLRIDSIKLHAREEKLMAEFFDVLADEMMDD